MVENDEVNRHLTLERSLLKNDEYLQAAFDDLKSSIIAKPVANLLLFPPGTAIIAENQKVLDRDREYGTGPYALIGNKGEMPQGWISWDLDFTKYQDHQFDKGSILDYDVPFNTLMRHLRDHQAAFFVPACGPDEGKIAQVVFPLYLNHFQARTFLYYWIVSLEKRLIQYISLRYPTDEKFKGLLDRVFAKTVNEDRERREKDEIDKTLQDRKKAGQTNARLSECIDLWHALLIMNELEGSPNKKLTITWLSDDDYRVDAKDAKSISLQDLKNISIGDIRKLRNSIMHPMSLVVTNDDTSVAKLVQKYILVKKMADVIQGKIIAKYG